MERDSCSGSGPDPLGPICCHGYPVMRNSIVAASFLGAALLVGAATASAAPVKQVGGEGTTPTTPTVPVGDTQEVTQLTVTGMTCGSCAASIESRVSTVPFVESVRADVETGIVLVTWLAGGTPDVALVRATIIDLGYEVTE